MKRVYRNLKYGFKTVVSRAKADPYTAVAAAVVDVAIGAIGALVVLALTGNLGV